MRVGVAIATRNNEKGIEALLKSIQNCDPRPNQISIVSSGRDISAIINIYSNKMHILYEDSDIFGQVQQRKLAISKIIESSDAILFLDDDVVVDQNFFRILNEDLSKISNDVWGMGTQLISSQPQNTRIRKYRKFLQNQSEIPGRVLKSGLSTSYQNAQKFSKTQWLNGLSIWRKEALIKYRFPNITGSYAAAEDLIFSYNVSKEYTLVTNNELILFDQTKIPSERNIFNRTLSQFCHLYYFIQINRELSIFWFFINFILSYGKSAVVFLRGFKIVNMQIFLAMNCALVRIIKFNIIKTYRKIKPEWLLVK